MTCFPCHAIVTLLSTYNCVAVNCFKLTSYFFRPSNCLRLIDNVFYCKAAFETVLILTKFKQKNNSFCCIYNNERTDVSTCCLYFMLSCLFFSDRNF